MNWAARCVEKISAFSRGLRSTLSPEDRQAQLERKAKLMQLPNLVQVGTRAHCEEIVVDGVSRLKKVFDDTEAARYCMTREITAREIFRGRAWIVRILETGDDYITLPMLPAERRLDRLAKQLSRDEKKEICRQSLQIAFEIFLAGYAHRDFHAKNMFWIDNQLQLVDFEVLHPYPTGRLPAFPESYDLIGDGLESPFHTANMCYTSSNPASLSKLLGIPLNDALLTVEETVKKSLNAASLTFARKGKRHICRAQKTYNSIDLPFLKVDPAVAQRNCTLRFRTLGITEQDIRGKSLLDLGSNIGGMIFEAQRFGPKMGIGVEYDAEKVEVATMVAAYNGLNKVSFLQADIDTLNAADLGEPFGVVFCFAIEAHVRKKRRLYELLAEVCTGKLYFEGNATTEAENARDRLLAAGFKGVQMLGTCNDDAVAANNNRPLLIATR